MIIEIQEALDELKDDFSVPKNIKIKISEICTCLQKVDEIQLNKIMDSLDEISNDINLQPYIRTQIWNITTMVESAKSGLQVFK